MRHATKYQRYRTERIFGENRTCSKTNFHAPTEHCWTLHSVRTRLIPMHKYTYTHNGICTHMNKCTYARIQRHPQMTQLIHWFHWYILLSFLPFHPFSFLHLFGLPCVYFAFTSHATEYNCVLFYVCYHSHSYEMDELFWIAKEQFKRKTYYDFLILVFSFQ